MAPIDPTTSLSRERAPKGPDDGSLVTEELLDESEPAPRTEQLGDDTADDATSADIAGPAVETASPSDDSPAAEQPAEAAVAARSDDERVAPHRHRPGRRVTRVVRRVQLWSVFKLALFGSLIFYVICMLSVALLWSIAMSTGQIHHIERFMRDIGFNDWTFDGPVLFLAALNIGAVCTVLTSVMATVSAAIMNLVSELTGGIRFTVIEALDEDDDD